MMSGRRSVLLWLTLISALVAMLAWSVWWPAVDADIADSVRMLRGWRTAAAALTGAALAVAGVLVQGLFRNPLASPSILGTSAGAALGGQLVLVAQVSWAATLPLWLAPEALLPAGCLLGAGLSLLIVRSLAGRGDDSVSLLLAGVILSTFLAGIAALVTALALDSWQIGRALVAFGMGGVDGKGAGQVLMVAPLIGIGILAAWNWSRELDVLLSGPDEAASMGVDTIQVTRWILIWTSVLVGAAVAVAGGIAFVGLVVPHVVRAWIGFEHRRLIPACAVVGATLVAGCDVFVRALPGGELPLGVITALIGAPIFFVLLLRARRQGVVA